MGVSLDRIGSFSDGDLSDMMKPPRVMKEEMGEGPYENWRRQANVSYNNSARRDPSWTKHALLCLLDMHPEYNPFNS